MYYALEELHEALDTGSKGYELKQIIKQEITQALWEIDPTAFSICDVLPSRRDAILKVITGMIEKARRDA